MNYKIIIQSEEKDGEGREIWRRYDDNLFSNDERIVEVMKEMYEAISEHEEEKPVEF